MDFRGSDTILKLKYFLFLFPIFLSAQEFSVSDSLPNNMPISKKIFWSENGLFRKTSFAPKSRIEELKLRRNMLQTHQKLGVITLGMMALQSYCGQQLIDGDYKYKEIHQNLGYATTGVYFTTASFSILSPPARKYSHRVSSIKLHRWLAIIHFTGMIAQPWLGYKSASESNGYHAQQYKQWHVQVGNVTLISFALAFLTTILPY